VRAEGLPPEPLARARHFAARHDNVTVFELPGGTARESGLVHGELYRRHLDDILIQLEEDVFVTPHWLEHLLDGYLEHLGRADVPVVMPLVPVSPVGRLVLGHYLRVAYPSERSMYAGPPVEENWVYHRWIWERLLHEQLAEIYLRDDPRKYNYVGQASANCLILDRRVLERLLPRLTLADGGLGLMDAGALNAVLRQNRMQVAVLGRSLVHHYSYAACEDYLRSHVPLDQVWRYLQGIPRERPTLRRRCPVGAGESRLLRVGGWLPHLSPQNEKTPSLASRDGVGWTGCLVAAGTRLFLHLAERGHAADFIPGKIGICRLFSEFFRDAHELVAEKQGGVFVDFAFVDLDFHTLAQFARERAVQRGRGVLENFFQGLLLHASELLLTKKGIVCAFHLARSGALAMDDQGIGRGSIGYFAKENLK